MISPLKLVIDGQCQSLDPKMRPASSNISPMQATPRARAWRCRGYGGGQIGDELPAHSAAFRFGNEGRVIALKLGGGAPPLPALLERSPIQQPPQDNGRPEQIARGEVLYNRFCARCHVLGAGVLPDLRRLTSQKHALFYDIVLNGLLQPLGMGRFDDVLSKEDAESLHAYIVRSAWQEFQHPAADERSGPDH